MSALGYTFEITYVDGTTETLRGSSRVHDGVLTITGTQYKAESKHIPLVQIKHWTSRDQ